MNFSKTLENEFETLKKKCNIEKYKLTPRAFSMESNWTFFDYILFILTNKGKSLTLEIEDFVEEYFDDDEEKLITKEAVSKQRQKFDFEIFKDLNKSFMKKFYKSEEYKGLFKDKIVLICDGSKSEIPNTPESKEWANIEENSLTNRKAARVLFSTLIDARYGVVLDSILGKSDSSERYFLKQHIKNIKGVIDYNDIILLIDAGYYSLELKLFLEKLGIKYVFRLPPTTYKKEISQMNGYDENLKISNTTSRRRSITDENILKRAEQLLFIENRIVKIPILNEEDKEDELILLTNLNEKEASTYEVTGLYSDRWEIEVNYDRLKNKMDLENYSGKLELTISQDFYSSIYIFNLAMLVRALIQKDLERKNKNKRKKENKEHRTNINILIGRIKKRLIKLFTSSKQKIKRIVERIIKRCLKTTYLYDFNRPKIRWHRKIFIGKFRFNQRRNI